MATHNLVGRIFLTGSIKAITGLRVGGISGSLAIGGVDLPVIRDALTNQPYIPGSSLKGKMRSLSEKWTNAPQNKSVGDPKIHVAGGDKPPKHKEADYRAYQQRGSQQYKDYWVNPIFGVPGEIDFEITAPNRLIVRDTQLAKTSANDLLKARTDMPYTEIKWEVVIDRVTSQANPRQIERVPAGAVFGPMEMVFNVYLKEDVELFNHLLTAMQLLEDDYLGGHGSRGSGKIKFDCLAVVVRAGDTYDKHERDDFHDLGLESLISKKSLLTQWLDEKLFPTVSESSGETPTE